MLARNLLLSFLVEIVVLAAAARYGLGVPLTSSIAGAAVCIVVVRVVAALACFLLAECFRSPRPASMRIGVRGWVRLLFAEIWAVVRVFFVLHPLEPWMNEPDALACGTRTPILLVHGFFSNGGYWWGIKRYLRRNGVDSLYTVNLEPPFCSIDALAEQLARRVAVIRQATGHDEVVLVAHSMGGLVCRAYLQRFDGARHTKKLITLGTPHAGTIHAHLLPGDNMRQMRPRSDWLQALSEGQDWTREVAATSIYSMHDNIIAPQESGALVGARNLPVAGVGHLEMTFSPIIQRLILQTLTIDA